MKTIQFLIVILLAVLVGGVGATIYWNTKFRNTYEGLLVGMDLETGLDKVLEAQLALRVIYAEGIKNKDRQASNNLINAYLGYVQRKECSFNNFLCNINSELDRGSIWVDDKEKMLGFKNKLSADMLICELTTEVCEAMSFSDASTEGKSLNFRKLEQQVLDDSKDSKE